MRVARTRVRWRWRNCECGCDVHAYSRWTFVFTVCRNTIFTCSEFKKSSKISRMAHHDGYGYRYFSKNFSLTFFNFFSFRFQLKECRIHSYPPPTSPQFPTPKHQGRQRRRIHHRPQPSKWSPPPANTINQPTKQATCHNGAVQLRTQTPPPDGIHRIRIRHGHVSS